MARRNEQDLPPALPFEPGWAGNGEFVPRERTWRHAMAAALAHERAVEAAQRFGLDRRRFLQGLSGLAVTLGAINVAACSDGGDGEDGQPAGTPGGRFDVPEDGEPAACENLTGDEFIFDVQTHHINPEGPWVENNPALAVFLGILRGLGEPPCTETERTDCLSLYYYLKDIFLDSDTTMAVLSDLPSPSDAVDSLTFAEMRRSREIIDRLSDGGAGRLLLHSIVVPNVGPRQGQLDLMQARVEERDIAAWKVYTPYGPGGVGWFLDDEATGIPFIEHSLSLGINRIAAHKGFPLQGFSLEHASPRDVGVVAKAYPEMNFIIYHSGYDPQVNEGPWDPDNAERGTNSLIKTLLDNGIAPNANVYAELGTTWRNVMSDPTQAAHVLGKLLKYVGEDNVIWGTDCVWHGSPQPQIVAFRAFQMDAAFREMHEYPDVTPAVKRKVLGLNGARVYGVDPEAQRCAIDRDEVERLRTAYRNVEDQVPEARWQPRGPISRRGLLTFFRQHGGTWSPGM